MKKTQGFTLIEMLIVIAVIGVLAVAVLSAINPIEQMRKARDTRRRSNAAELLNALERYYATFEVYDDTFLAAAEDGTGCDVAVVDGIIAEADLDDLIAVNELKSEFAARINDAANTLYAAIDEAGGSDLATVCYEIESMANITNYLAADNCCLLDGTACIADSGQSHFVCLPE